MIVAYPSVAGVSVVLSPSGMKVLKRVWFADKNGGSYEGDGFLKGVSLSVDGRVVLEDVVLLPFCTRGVDGCPRDYRDVSIPMNVRVDGSELKLKCERTNDFCVCMEFDDEWDEGAEEWFMWMECVDLVLKGEGGDVSGVVSEWRELRSAPERCFLFPYEETSGGVRMASGWSLSAVGLRVQSGGGEDLLPEGADVRAFESNDYVTWKDAAYEVWTRGEKEVSLRCELSEGLVSDLGSADVTCAGVMVFFASRVFF